MNKSIKKVLNKWEKELGTKIKLADYDEDDEYSYIDKDDEHFQLIFPLIKKPVSYYDDCLKISFKLQEMINCCAITVLTEINSEESKFYPLIHEMAAAIAKIQGYSMVLTTDVGESRRKKLFESNWEQVNHFINRRTARKVFTFQKKV